MQLCWRLKEWSEGNSKGSIDKSWDIDCSDWKHGGEEETGRKIVKWGGNLRKGWVSGR